MLVLASDITHLSPRAHLPSHERDAWRSRRYIPYWRLSSTEICVVWLARRLQRNYIRICIYSIIMSSIWNFRREFHPGWLSLGNGNKRKEARLCSQDDVDSVLFSSITNRDIFWLCHNLGYIVFCYLFQGIQLGSLDTGMTAKSRNSFDLMELSWPRTPASKSYTGILDSYVRNRANLLWWADSRMSTTLWIVSIVSVEGQAANSLGQ